jgi:hypothetical protein
MMVEDAILLLAAAGNRTMKVKEAVEIIEMVTRDPRAIKEILMTGESRGLIKRDEMKIVISGDAAFFPKPKINKVDCESSCRRCGIKIKNCFYIELDNRRLGPYGSECVGRIL